VVCLARTLNGDDVIDITAIKAERTHASER
jgi:hypothetical protein